MAWLWLFLALAQCGFGLAWDLARPKPKPRWNPCQKPWLEPGQAKARPKPTVWPWPGSRFSKAKAEPKSQSQSQKNTTQSHRLVVCLLRSTTSGAHAIVGATATVPPVSALSASLVIVRPQYRPVLLRAVVVEELRVQRVEEERKSANKMTGWGDDGGSAQAGINRRGCEMG
ncbi:hypothetical protein DFH08DRAFT_821316 [Mycena albidolilacea]|uniref:Secreted protein n=1 Tax=Mycena albidolilacea TaxID=1033008 RepID=A0AAD7EDT1_9AGAR|nr:hypothetical protein DFH08DRAFT_821316 [Mycena albidolilacea]